MKSLLSGAWHFLIFTVKILCLSTTMNRYESFPGPLLNSQVKQVAIAEGQGHFQMFPS